MKAIRLFSLELRRLLLSRLTWLIALLTLLSPLAGLTLYKPASPWWIKAIRTKP